MGIEEPMATGRKGELITQIQEVERYDDAKVEIERLVGASGMGARTAIDGQVPIIDMSKEGAAAWDPEGAEEPSERSHPRNHGVPLELIERTFGRSAKFFDQSKEQKQEQSPFAKDLNAGYECFAFEGWLTSLFFAKDDAMANELPRMKMTMTMMMTMVLWMALALATDDDDDVDDDDDDDDHDDGGTFRKSALPPVRPIREGEPSNYRPEWIHGWTLAKGLQVNNKN
ncbi:hypothetical protein AK812_SmicGene4176 [Symbiodinium microadriaticum]|uniref:Uncharacterized protein n=1 Tax=Symbiodinium microadriaticum TaxID=2951 RepID=A0A1Q9EX07_SYMMI|nr:hypothetical protein AK812_SmicGene4176 [Symbiodinium microadriaticum]